MNKKEANPFAAIIATRQHEESEETVAPAVPKKRVAKRGHPDYSQVTVYIPTEVYALAQFHMARQGRKREMSDLFSQLLREWLNQQDKHSSNPAS